MQVRQFIKLGIPDDMRGQVWNKMIGSQAIKVISSFDYQVNIMIIDFDKYRGVKVTQGEGYNLEWKKEVMLIDLFVCLWLC